MKLRLLALFLLISVFSVRGQDPHFSQFNMSPVFQNPAQSGNFDGTSRICLVYRNQWNSITTPFTTFFGGVDLQVKRKRPGKDYMGTGLYLLRDKAGDGGYGITAASFSGAYFHSLSHKRDNYLSFGFSAAAVENSINFDRLSFPDQYDGTQYNPGITHGEFYGREWTYYLDVSAGILWSLNKPDGKKYALGLSVFHVNRPNHSLLKDQIIPLKTRWQVQGNMGYPLDNSWTLQPCFYYQQQEKHPEFIIGSYVHYKNRSSSISERGFYGGIETRMKDAAIIVVGVENDNLNVGMSYDINYSRLRKASYLKGGVEIAIQYIFNKPRGVLKRGVTCPIF